MTVGSDIAVIPTLRPRETAAAMRARPRVDVHRHAKIEAASPCSPPHPLPHAGTPSSRRPTHVSAPTESDGRRQPGSAAPAVGQHKRGHASVGARRRGEAGFRPVEHPTLEADLRTFVRDARRPKRGGATACRIRDLPTQSPSASTALRLRLDARRPTRATIEMSPKERHETGRLERERSRPERRRRRKDFGECAASRSAGSRGRWGRP